MSFDKHSEIDIAMCVDAFPQPEQQPDPAPTIPELVELVHTLRLDANSLDFAVLELRQRWEADHAVLLTAQREKRAEVKAAEDKLRGLAVQVYDADPSTKKLHEHVAIRVSIDGEVTYEESEAVKWVQEHEHSDLLTVKADEFEKLAKVLRPKFVKFKDTITATISTKLGAISLSTTEATTEEASH